MYDMIVQCLIHTVMNTGNRNSTWYNIVVPVSLTYFTIPYLRHPQYGSYVVYNAKPTGMHQWLLHVSFTTKCYDLTVYHPTVWYVVYNARFIGMQWWLLHVGFTTNCQGLAVYYPTVWYVVYNASLLECTTGAPFVKVICEKTVHAKFFHDTDAWQTLSASGVFVPVAGKKTCAIPPVSVAVSHD